MRSRVKRGGKGNRDVMDPRPGETERLRWWLPSILQGPLLDTYIRLCLFVSLSLSLSLSIPLSLSLCLSLPVSVNLPSGPVVSFLWSHVWLRCSRNTTRRRGSAARCLRFKKWTTYLQGWWCRDSQGTHTDAHTHIHTHTHTRKTHTKHFSFHTHTDTHTHAHTHMHTHRLTHTHILFTYTHTDTHTQTHTQTHTHSLSPPQPSLWMMSVTLIAASFAPRGRFHKDREPSKDNGPENPHRTLKEPWKNLQGNPIRTLKEPSYNP